ncbi:MAG: mechanosensitive ion channel family protein, partial [Pseudomonadota bacterium]
MTKFLFCLLLGLWLALVPGVTLAQSYLPGVSTSSGTEPDTDGSLADAIKQAADSGVSVVIIDSNGNLVSAGGAASKDTAEDSADPMGGSSQLMKAQANLEEFRQSLSRRLEALPYSIFEVQYILRQTSPDGRIMTYVEVLLWTVGFLLLGRWLSIEIYGKRIARRYVVSRIKENPEGYREKMPFLVFRFLMGILGTVIAMIFALIAGQ